MASMLKECLNVDPLQFAYTLSRKEKERIKKEHQQDNINGIPLYIISKLKHYSNCYVSTLRYDVKKISKIVGFKVVARRCISTSGYVLEKEI